MSKWEICQLGELVTFQRGHDLLISQFKSGKCPVIGSSGIIGYHNKSTTKGPGVVIGRSGNSVGKVHYSNSDYWAHNTTLYVKSFHNTDPKFIYYLLTCYNLGRFEGGSAVPPLNRNHIHPLEFLVPTHRKEQEKVSSLFSSLDAKIALLRKQSQTLENIAQTLFKRWFVDFEFPHEDGKPYKSSGGKMVASELGEIPEGWSIEPLSIFLDFLEGPGIRNWQYTDYGIRFINIRLIDNGDLDIHRANYVSEEEAMGKYKHFLLEPKDMVVSTSGTLGRSAIVRKCHLPLLLNTSVIRFRPKDKNNYGFMYQYLNSRYFIDELFSLASGSVQLNFGPMHLNQIEMIIPSKVTLDRFQDVVSPVYEKIIANLDKTQILIKTRDTLLPKLMSGQIRVRS